MRWLRVRCRVLVVMGMMVSVVFGGSAQAQDEGRACAHVTYQVDSGGEEGPYGDCFLSNGDDFMDGDPCAGSSDTVRVCVVFSVDDVP